MSTTKKTAERFIKKYPNRRLYDTETSTYITLSDVKQLVLDQEEFKVIDAKTNEDLTRSILLQIILEEESGQGAFPFVLHCFTAGQELAERSLALGGYISFSGIITFRNAKEIQDVARIVPADRYLVETDSPYLAPIPHRGESNEPSYVRHTAEKVAEIRGVSLEQVGRESTENFFRLFSKATQ